MAGRLKILDGGVWKYAGYGPKGEQGEPSDMLASIYDPAGGARQVAFADELGSGGVSDHGALTGLGDDDHTQYHNDTRGDARYYTKAQVDTSLSGKSDTAHTHTAANITDFDTEVSNNTDVAANTTARHTHANQAVLDATTASFTTADETKLDGIATGATANDTDANLKNRANHTGTQTASTISDFDTEVSNNTDVAAATTHIANTSNPHSVTKTQVGLGNVDNTSDADKPVSTATQTALDAKKPKTSLVSDITYPYYASHRGGKSVYPEMSMEAFEHCATSTFALECDVRALSDGTLVLIHDSTVDRTMTGATGNVSAISPETWQNMRINPVIDGGKEGTPVFFEDFLNIFGGRHLIVAELKDYGTSTPINAFIAAIKDRGLEDDMIVQCFDQTTAETFAQAGLHSMFLFGTSTAAVPADLVTAGVEYVGASYSTTSGTLSPFISAGLIPWAYTINTLANLATAETAGFTGFFSDDPWYISGRYTTDSTIRMDGYLWPGYKSYNASGTNPDVDTSSYIKGEAVVATSTDAGHAGQVVVVHAPPVGKITAPFRISMRIRFREDSTSTAGAGLVLYKNTSDPETNFKDAARTGQEGFTAMLRRNGQMQVWKYVAGAAASSITSSTALTGTAMVAPLDQPGTATFEFEHTGTNVYLRCPELKTVVSAADTFVPTDMTLLLRGAAVRDYEISDIRVYMSQAMFGSFYLGNIMFGTSIWGPEAPVRVNPRKIYNYGAGKGEKGDIGTADTTFRGNYGQGKGVAGEFGVVDITTQGNYGAKTVEKGTFIEDQLLIKTVIYYIVVL